MITCNHMAFRRVTVELPSTPLVRAGFVPESFFRHNESLEILHVYAFGPRERVLLVRVVRSGHVWTRDGLGRRRDVLRRRYGLRDFDVLQIEDRGHAYVALVRQVNSGLLEEILASLGAGATLTTPTVIRRDTTILSFLADEPAETQAFSLLDGLGAGWSLRRRAIVRSAPTSAGLTARQREVLSLAWNLGYFDIPARVGLERLAAVTGLSRNTVSQHLRRGMRRILRETIG